jgi:DNA-binding transcriptional LysR family regulator
MDTSGRELQLEMVARGHGLGLVPRTLLAASAHHDALACVPLSDFKPEVDLWLVQARAPGALHAPIERFGAHVRRGLAGPHTGAHAKRASREHAHGGAR